jgi:hypothetical protein
MTLKKTTLILALATVGFAGAAATAADAQPLHPAKHEVLARVHAQKAQIKAEARAGRISPMKAHRLLAADNRIARDVRAKGHLTPAATRRLNHQENRIHRHINS